jgi:hypothetical protein
MLTEFKCAWAATFPNCPPYPPMLRSACPERWLRIHSLPRAKRYATTANEKRLLLERHETVADRLLSSDRASCALVVTYANGYRGKGEPSSVTSRKMEIATEWLEPAWRDSSIDDDLDETVFAVSPFTYRRGDLAPLIVDVADDRTASLLMFNMESGRAYAPYDGGADLFFTSSEERDQARRDFSKWLSPRSDGL